MRQKVGMTASVAEHRRKAAEYRGLANRVTTEWVRKALLAQAASHDEKAMSSEDRGAISAPRQLEPNAADATGHRLFASQRARRRKACSVPDSRP